MNGFTFWYATVGKCNKTEAGEGKPCVAGWIPHSTIICIHIRTKLCMLHMKMEQGPGYFHVEYFCGDFESDA